MAKYLIIFLFCLSSFSQTNKEAYSLAQKYHQGFNNSIHKPTDSATIYLNLLKNLSVKNTNPIFKVWYYQDLGYTFFTKTKNLKSIIEYKKSLKIALKNDYSKEIIESKNWIANNYILVRENQKAITLYQEILEQAKKENNVTALITAWTGLANDENLTIEQQLKLNLKIDSISTTNNIETAVLTNTYSWIGETYLHHFNNEKLAIQYLKKSLRIAKKIDYIPGIQHVAMLLSDIAITNKDYTLAKENYINLIKQYKNYNPKLVANSFSELTEIALKEKKYGEALNYIVTSETILTKIQDTLGLDYLRFRKAKVYLKLHNLKATKHIIEGFKKNKNAVFKTDSFLINFYKLQSDYYLETTNYKQAFVYYKKRDSLKILFQTNNNNKQFAELDTKYQSAKKEKKITVLQAKNKLIIQQKKYQKNLLLVGLILSALIGFFFFILFKNKQRITKTLKELAVAKSDFFSNITHELRTPLTLISGPTQSLLKKESFSKSERKNLHLIQKNSDRLLHLIDQLLDVSKLKSGVLQLQVSYSTIFYFTKVLLDSFVFMAKQKNITFLNQSKDTIVKGYFDKDFLHKIITNLTTNALKYTHKNGTIILNYQVKKDVFIFEIKNSGKGLTQHEIEQLFNRFYQVKNTSNGVGIGLALVKELVTLHKGTIKVKSKPNKWTRFILTIPIDKNAYLPKEIVVENILETTNEISQIKINPKQNKPILLIVEDVKDVQDYIVSIFNKNYTILTANNGEIGVDMALKHIPDLIISDIMMPIKNGNELCKSLKLDERTSHIPIILLTAKSKNQDKIEGLQTGADAYITKPFNEDILQLKVANLLQSRKELQKKYSTKEMLSTANIIINDVEVLFIEKLQKIIDTNLTETSFTIDEFSSLIGMSRMQLHRKLKALFNVSTSEFITTERLKLATTLLIKTNVNISEVAYAVGFNNPTYFSKCFKKQYHFSPSNFVKQNS